MQPHNEFRINAQAVQIGCYWGDGGHTDLYLLEGATLAIIDTGVSDTPSKYIAPALEPYGRTLADIDIILNTHGPPRSYWRESRVSGCVRGEGVHP